MREAGSNLPRRVERGAALAALMLVTAAVAAAVIHAAACEAHSQSSPRSVRTRDGVEFALPASLREAAVPQQPAGLPGAIERVYSEPGSSPLQLFVSRNEAQRGSSLPPPSAAVTHDYTAGFVTGARERMKLAQIYDVSPGSYDPEHSAFSVLFKTRAAPRARQLLQQPDALVTPVESSIASIAFFTRSALVQILVVAPSARTADVRSTAALVVSSSRISPGSKLQVSIFHELEDMSAFTLGRLLGAIVGPFFVVVLVGGCLAWLLHRFGVAPALAASATCALLALLAAIGALWTADFSIFTICQLLSYLLASLVAVRPMIRWLGARDPLRT